jgi:hypothetical protein
MRLRQGVQQCSAQLEIRNLYWAVAAGRWCTMCGPGIAAIKARSSSTAVHIVVCVGFRNRQHVRSATVIGRPSAQLYRMPQISKVSAGNTWLCKQNVGPVRCTCNNKFSGQEGGTLGFCCRNAVPRSGSDGSPQCKAIQQTSTCQLACELMYPLPLRCKSDPWETSTD